MSRALSRIVAERPLVVIGAWILLTVSGFALALGVVGEGLFARLGQEAPSVPGQARTGQDLLLENSPEGPQVGLAVLDVDRADPAIAATLTAAYPDLTALDGVAAVADPVTVPDATKKPDLRALIGTGGDAFLVSVQFEKDEWTDADVDAVAARLTTLGSELERAGAGDTMVGGGQLLYTAVTDQVSKDLARGETFALPVSLLVMVVVFGGFLAAGAPIIGAIASIAMSLVGLLGFSYLLELDVTAVNVVSVLGLGLCIDYGLLIVSRFREELRAVAAPGSNGDDLSRAEVLAALYTTMRTAGRTVAFSAVTIAISLAGLLFFEAEVLRAIGAAGISIVIVALVVALTLVPALLMVRGRRMLRPGILTRVPGIRGLVGRFGDVPPAAGFFSRLARRTQRHPFLVGGLVLIALVVLALPALRIEVRNSAVDLLPIDHPDRQYFELLEQRFPTTALPSIEIVGEATPRAMGDLYRATVKRAAPNVVTEPRPVGGGYSVIEVFTDDPASRESRSLAEDLIASRPTDYQTWVTGQSGNLVDFLDSISNDAIPATAVVLVATFVLLFLMTGSVLIPIKALIMNVVSLGAAIGVLVFVFQDGNLSGLLDFTSPGGVETVIPILILAFGFGLAMDYEVFLLSRIKEFHDRGQPNDAAVVAGLQRSGRIITSAALVIVLVFLGFTLGDLLIVKETGIGLAVAVAVDATLIRCLLVPATMTVLGEWNWWAPAPLRRIYQRWQLRD